MRIISIANHSIFNSYDLTQAFLWSSVVLNNSWPWYYFADQSGFSWWAGSAHKCNFSIMVIWQEWCQIAYASGYPANWFTLGAVDTWLNPSCGATAYWWQFYGSNGWYRLGWTVPTSYMPYYDSRMASYLMIR
jgi:hypothetical protein